jgi:TP901 family phage tail tape measure protein
MAGPIRIAILANGAQARREATLTSNSLTRMGGLSQKAGKLIAGAFAISGLIRVAGAVGEIGSAYVDSLNKIQALTGSTDAQTERAAKALEGQAGALAKYGQTAGDAASGVVELTKSGLSLDKALSAVRSTLVLAKAGELEVADASELVANTLNTFHLRAQRAGDIANFLANAANVSSSDVTDLAESFKYVSPLAAKSGITLGQTSAILAELSNSGIKASQAGTSLRGILIGLQTPTTAGAISLQELGVAVYDAEGKMRPFKKILEDLRQGLGKVGQEQQNFDLKNIFGRNALTAAQVLVRGGSKELATYTTGVRRAGAAEDLAASASKGLAGTLGSVKAQVTTGAQSLYREYSPAIDDAVQKGITWIGNQQDAASELLDHVVPAVKSVVDLLGDLAGATGDAAAPLKGDLLPALESIFDVVKAGADALDSLPDGVKKIGVEAGIAALVLPKLTASVTGVTNSVGFNIARLQQFRAEMITTTRSLQQTNTLAATPTSFVGLAMPNAAMTAKYVGGLKVVETQSLNTKAALAKIGPAAKAAAGVGGLVLLTEGAKQSNKALGDLELVAGGIATGAAFGGLPGAVAGGIGGALAAVKAASDGAASSFQLAKPKAESFADAIDKVSGAAKRSANDVARLSLQQSGALEAGQRLGVSTRDLVKYTLGNEGAIKRVSAALAVAQPAVASYIDGYGVSHTYLAQATIDQGKLAAALGVTSNQLASDRKAAQDAAIANGELARSLKTISGDKRRTILTKIETKGYPETARQVAAITRGVNLTPKQLGVVIKQTGAKATVAEVQAVIDKAKSLDKTKPKGPDLKGAVRASANQAEPVASQGGANVVKRLERELAKTKAKMPQLVPTLNTLLGGASTTARTGGSQIGTALKQGLPAGFAGADGLWSNSVARAVHAAIAAGRAAADAHSPSRETEKLGQDLGDGLVVGMNARRATAAKGGADLVSAALAGLYDYTARASGGIATDNVGTAIDNVTSLIEKTFDQRLAAADKRLKKKLKGKAEDNAIDRAEKKSNKAQQSALSSLRDQFAAQKRIATQYDELQSGDYTRYLDKNSDLYRQMTGDTEHQVHNLGEARDRLKELTDQAKQYADQVRDSVVASGSITGFGEGDGFGSVDQLISQLRAKVASAQAYAQVIQALTAAGLNQTNLQQLIDAGVEGGLGTAQAILAGGPAAISQINTLTGQLVTTGTQLGTTTSQNLYGAGVAAAQGLVAGLESQQAMVEAAAVALGNTLARAIRKALKIKSPSRVFRDIGDNTVKGLALGLDETYVKRQGTRLADSLQTGFSTPALDAYVTRGGAPSSGGNTYVTVQATPGTDKVALAKEIQSILDAGARAGVRAGA